MSQTLASKKGKNRKSNSKDLKTNQKKGIKLQHSSNNDLIEIKNIPAFNSIDEGCKAFRWILNPLKYEEFIKTYWEKSPCLIKRNEKSYFQNLLSFSSIDRMLQDNHIEFTKNIDITSYKEGIRETHNPDGRALAPIVWKSYGEGCSIRLLNPQTYIPAMHILNATLQEFFHCMIGANVYLTPPNSQGFAPHYDDIEAFVLQVEGKKRWKLYHPRSIVEVLPRCSSSNFVPTEIGQPFFDGVLEAGDVLYFPRGTIHQACTEKGHHSLHITLSVYQKNSYADLFESLFPLMLSKAIESSSKMREGLPLNIWRNMGLVYSDIRNRERKDISKTIQRLFNDAVRKIPFDAAVDQIAKRFQHDAIQPYITEAERKRTIFGLRNELDANGHIQLSYELRSSTKIRLIRANVIRLIEEEGRLRIYFYVDNSKQYHEYEPNFIEIDSDSACVVDMLIKTYPNYVSINELPSDNETNLSVCQDLFDRGILMSEYPII